jgi:hypothetical protein
MVWLNLAVRLIVELLGVLFVGYWGLNASDDTATGVVLAVGAVIVFAVVWGLFLAPTADRGLSKRQKDVIGTIVLLVAALALAVAGQSVVALVYAIVVLVNAVALWLLGDKVDRALTRSGPTPR